MTKKSSGYETTRYNVFITNWYNQKIKKQKSLQDINMFLTPLKLSAILKVKGSEKAVFIRRKLNK